MSRILLPGRPERPPERLLSVKLWNEALLRWCREYREFESQRRVQELRASMPEGGGKETPATRGPNRGGRVVGGSQ